MSEKENKEIETPEINEESTTEEEIKEFLKPVGEVKLGEDGEYHDERGLTINQVTGLAAANPSGNKKITFDGGTLMDITDSTISAGVIRSGYGGYNSSGNWVSGSISSKAAATYTATDSQQTISSGYYLSGTQTIAATPYVLKYADHLIPMGGGSASRNSMFLKASATGCYAATKDIGQYYVNKTQANFTVPTSWGSRIAQLPLASDDNGVGTVTLVQNTTSAAITIYVGYSSSADPGSSTTQVYTFSLPAYTTYLIENIKCSLSTYSCRTQIWAINPGVVVYT